MEEENNDKFKIVSKIYGEDFNTVTFIIFNSETGEFTSKTFNSKIELDNENGLEIRADTANNIQDEIIRLLNNPPRTRAGFIWNDALLKAAECCNGYELEEI